MTMNITTSKRIIAFLFAFIFIFSITVPAFAATTTTMSAADQAEYDRLEKERNQYQKEIEESKAKRKEIQKEINETKEKAEPYEKEINALQKEISTYQKQINTLNASITALDKRIASTEAQIETQRQKIEETQKILGERLRAMYMAGNTSTIEIIFEADDFADLLNRIELSARIAKHDNEVVTALKNEIANLDAMIQQLEEDKIDLQSSKDEILAAQTEVKAAKVEVDKKLDVLEDYMDKLDRKSAEYKRIEKKLETAMSEAADEMDALIRGKTDDDYQGNPSKTGFIWPVANSGSYISSPYGNRSSGFHKGIDITCGGAKNGNVKIVAAAAGKVITISDSCTHNYGKSGADPCGSSGLATYGKYVVIEHGSGYTTLYAHLGSIKVHVGQEVKRGDTIGIMGSTGHSTGFHLHFEVRINGERKNPSNYVHK